jgi:acetolactate synthase-1/2/3 large subunit
LKARDMLTLDRPDPDWVSIARGYGVEAARVTDLDGLMREMTKAIAVNGPSLVELVI